MINKIKKLVAYVSLIVGTVFVLSFVSIKKNQKEVNGFIINVLDTGLFFINQEETEALLLDLGYDTGALIDDINIANVERILTNTPFIKAVNVYIDISGNLCVNVKQRNPILRFYNKNKESFYISDDGMILRTSKNFSARVVVATGDIDYQIKSNLDTIKKDGLEMDLYDLAKFLNANEFWRAQIAHLMIDNRGRLTCIPQVGNHKIKFGQITNLEEKFDKLKLFYEKGLSKTGWNEYSEINLTFKDQIVCNKN